MVRITTRCGRRHTNRSSASHDILTSHSKRHLHDLPDARFSSDYEPTLKEGEALLQTICGAQLTSVDFVLDYLILGFGPKGALTTLVWPEIQNGDSVVRFGVGGYRDCLCEFITQVVQAVEITEDETIFITFENKSRLRIRLRDRKVPGERAIFSAPRHHLFAW
jgi:hypothetical protein